MVCRPPLCSTPADKGKTKIPTAHSLQVSNSFTSITAFPVDRPKTLAHSCSRNAFPRAKAYRYAWSQSPFPKTVQTTTRPSWEHAGQYLAISNRNKSNEIQNSLGSKIASMILKNGSGGYSLYSNERRDPCDTKRNGRPRFTWNRILFPIKHDMLSESVAPKKLVS